MIKINTRKAIDSNMKIKIKEKDFVREKDRMKMKRIK